MQYPSLSYFLVVAEFLNISQAAKYIHITQQGMSAYIKKLEEAYGVELFTRRPNFALTPEGELLYAAARQIEEIHARLEADLRQSCRLSASVALGVTHQVARYHMGRISLLRYRRLFPDVRVHTAEYSAQALEQMLLARQLDFYISDYPPADSRLTARPLFVEHYRLAVLDRLLAVYFPEEYPRCILRFEEGADLLEFAAMPFFAYPQSFHITARVGRLLAQTGVMLSTAGHSPSLETNMQMVLHGEGFTLVLESQTEAYSRRAPDESNILHMFPLTHAELSIPIYLISRQGEEYPPHVAGLIDLFDLLADEDAHAFV